MNDSRSIPLARFWASVLAVTLALVSIVGASCASLSAEVVATPPQQPAAVEQKVDGVGGGLPPEAAAPAAPAPVQAAPAPPASSAPEQKLDGIDGAAYTVMDGTSGRVLLQYHARERRSPASLTKIMTALLVLEAARLDDVVTVTPAITELRASTIMGLDPGENIAVRDVLYGLMLPSGNDAAVALASHIAGTERVFVDMMNAKARELGLKDTQFTNSHGLDFREFGNPYSSSQDLAELSRVAMANPVFRDLVASRSYVSRAGDRGPYLLVNYNSLLNSYPGANGIKIGHTRRAGHTIVASAWRDGVWLIAVVLGSKSRDGDAAHLLDEGFRLTHQG